MKVLNKPSKKQVIITTAVLVTVVGGTAIAYGAVSAIRASQETAAPVLGELPPEPPEGPNGEFPDGERPEPPESFDGEMPEPPENSNGERPELPDGESPERSSSGRPPKRPDDLADEPSAKTSTES